MKLTELLPKGIKYVENEPMSRHTTFRTGGPADLLVMPSSVQELSETLCAFRRQGIKPTVIGNGSNLLVSDKGIRGAVIKIGEDLSDMTVCGETVTCGAGAHLNRLCVFAAENGLSGAECLYGIPGTVGGAVYMNAGAYGSEIKDILKSVTYMDPDGVICELAGTEGYGYRFSPFTGTDNIIAGASFGFVHGDKEAVTAKMTEIKERRAEKQPLNFPSAGSTFKRPEGYFAGVLIEQSGLKGRSVGGACVSEKHAGFIVNKGGATTGDILELISIVQKQVYADHGVILETEVKFVGEE